MVILNANTFVSTSLLVPSLLTCLAPLLTFLVAPQPPSDRMVVSAPWATATAASTPTPQLAGAPPPFLPPSQAVHEHGGYGSLGYGYSWKRAEAEKNLLRTHTTAVSSRMLYNLAQGGFRPAKYFSIDRVFRNEAVDRTHLAEFHQVEGKRYYGRAGSRRYGRWAVR